MSNILSIATTGSISFAALRAGYGLSSGSLSMDNGLIRLTAQKPTGPVSASDLRGRTVESANYTAGSGAGMVGYSQEVGIGSGPSLTLKGTLAYVDEVGQYASAGSFVVISGSVLPQNYVYAVGCYNPSTKVITYGLTSSASLSTTVGAFGVATVWTWGGANAWNLTNGQNFTLYVFY